MTQAAPDIRVDSGVSLNVRALVIPSAQWESEPAPNGQIAFRPIKGTWFPYRARGRAAHDSVIVPMIGCPSCGALSYLCTEQSVRVLRGWTGALNLQPVHSVDHLGRVRVGKDGGDLRCGNGRCDFHRTVYLDRWLKKKPLFALAYVNEDRGNRIEIAYSHSVDTREARFHLGRGNFKIIAGGPAVGFFVDEKTGRVSTG